VNAAVSGNGQLPSIVSRYVLVASLIIITRNDIANENLNIVYIYYYSVYATQ